MNIKKLAEKLELSITTVSRGLGGYSDVSENYQKKNYQICKKIQFFS
jgi:Transcriptional regulators